MKFGNIPVHLYIFLIFYFILKYVYNLFPSFDTAI